MKQLGFLFTLLLFFITACSATENTMNDVIQANIQLPEQLSKETPSTFLVHITDGERNIDSDENVTFTIWKGEKKEGIETIQAVRKKKGIYQITKSFQKDGIYFVQTHISADNQQVMPKKRFVVGSLSEEEINTLTKQIPSTTHDQHQHH